MRRLLLLALLSCASAAHAQDVGPAVPEVWASDSAATAEWREGYRAGRSEAAEAASAGRRVVITGGLVEWYAEWSEELAPLGVELLWYTGCEPTPREDGYSQGYRSVMAPLLEAEIGEAALDAAESRGRARMVAQIEAQLNRLP